MGAAPTERTNLVDIQEKLAMLEKTEGVKLGLYALDTNTNAIIAYRADERFPVQSTMKLIAVAALLKEREADRHLLAQSVHYSEKDLAAWAPVTQKYVHTGLCFNALAEAAMTYSDNTAANLIIKKMGGPEGVTAFAHAMGNPTFNVEHYEGYLNSNPAHPEDSSTPRDMAISLRKLLLGSFLALKQRAKLLRWMQDNTTSYQRMRAGTPIGWMVADKTGTGDYGIANDIGILWSPLCKPIILAIYTVQNDKNAKGNNASVAAATSLVMDAFSKEDACFGKGGFF